MRSKRSTYEATRRFSVVAIIPGDEAATAANYGKIFVADRPCTVKKISESHTDPGDDAGAVTLSVERLQTTEAPGAGDDLLDATKINLKGTKDTVQAPALTPTGTNLILAIGDRLGLVDTGVMANVEGVCVTIDMEEGI